MTNQNDTQDEAEKLADEHCNKLGFFNRGNVWDAYLEGYRAGQASKELEVFRMLKNQVDISVKLQEENSRLKESLSAVTVVQQRDAAIKELAESRAEVERLNEKWRLLYNEVYEKEKVLNNALVSARTMKSIFEEQLAAEKQKALKLVEALKYYRGIVKGTWGYDGIIAAKYDNAISDYSTDSGDGGKS